MKQIHEAFTVTDIAIRYYAKQHPERNYSRHYAIKQWRQDKKINWSVVEDVILKIHKEQLKMLKSN